MELRPEFYFLQKDVMAQTKQSITRSIINAVLSMISLTYIPEKGNKAQIKWTITEFIKKDSMVQTK